MGSKDVRLADLGDAVKVIRGFPTQRAFHQGEIPIMSIAGLRNQSPARHFASRVDMDDLGLDLGRPADVLVSIEGGTVGETLTVQADFPAFVPSQQVATLRVIDSSALDPWYLSGWLATEGAREQLSRLARGQGIQRIAMKELSSLVVRVLPLAEQQEIGRRFAAFERAIRSHRSVMACLEQLREADLVLAFASHTANGTTTPAGWPDSADGK